MGHYPVNRRIGVVLADIGFRKPFFYKGFSNAFIKVIQTLDYSGFHGMLALEFRYECLILAGIFLQDFSARKP